ncbi:MAG TPA: hypothetical protein VFY45_17795 [Baekduia sp.]|nr:hypothetical protein [Baekduia sp.]
MTLAQVRRLATFAPPLLVGLFALPFILRQNSWWEWGNAYWLLERQTAHVSAHGVPTLFLHNFSGAYNPFYVFYSGFTLSLLAYPAALFGTWPVFVASVVAAMVGGYLGIWWTARNLGLSPQLAILPALTFATTPYVLSEIYGRGAWAELVAVNAAAVALGAVTALLWRPGPERSRGPALAALVAAGALVAGTHNITFMLSAILLPLVVLALLPLRARPGQPPLLPELARAASAVALGVGLTAAWLLPNLWFGPSTAIAHPSTFSNQTFDQTFDLLKITNLFSPLPRIPDAFEGRWLYAQAPALAAVWSLLAIAAIVWLRRRNPNRVLASLGGLVVLGITLVVLIVNSSWWTSFPTLIQAVQFSYRLIPYLTIVVALIAIIGLTTLAGQTGRWMVGALIAIVAVQVGAGALIVVHSKAGASQAVGLARHGDLTVKSEPASFAAKGLVVQLQFRVINDRIGDAPNQPPAQLHDINLITSDTGNFEGVGSVGDRMLVPVVWSRFVQVTGDAKIDGRDELGRSILAVTDTDAQGRWKATVQAAHPWQLTVGRLISLLSALAIAVLGLFTLRRRRRASPPPVADTDHAANRLPPAVRV